MTDSAKIDLLKRRRFFGAALGAAASMLAGLSFLPKILRQTEASERKDARVMVTPNPLAVPRKSKGPTAHV